MSYFSNLATRMLEAMGNKLSPFAPPVIDKLNILATPKIDSHVDKAVNKIVDAYLAVGAHQTVSALSATAAAILGNRAAAKADGDKSKGKDLNASMLGGLLGYGTGLATGLTARFTTNAGMYSYPMNMAASTLAGRLGGYAARKTMDHVEEYTPDLINDHIMN